jgi:hypothetical protein
MPVFNMKVHEVVEFHGGRQVGAACGGAAVEDQVTDERTTAKRQMSFSRP